MDLKQNHTRKEALMKRKGNVKIRIELKKQQKSGTEGPARDRLL